MSFILPYDLVENYEFMTLSVGHFSYNVRGLCNDRDDWDFFHPDVADLKLHFILSFNVNVRL